MRLHWSEPSSCTSNYYRALSFSGSMLVRICKCKSWLVGSGKYVGW